MIVFSLQPERRAASWHYGELLPEWVLTARVVQITADGDELDLLLDALRLTAARKVTPSPAPQLTEGTDNENPDR